MAEKPIQQVLLSSFEATQQLLAGAQTKPDLVAIDADHVLWPCASTHLAAAVKLHPDAHGVLSALHAASIKIAVVAAEDVSGANPPVPLRDMVQAAMDGAGLQGIVDIVHVMERAADEVVAGSRGSSNGAANQQQQQQQQQQQATVQQRVEAHWRQLRRVSGVAWSNCIAVVGSSSRLRAANRAGAGSAVIVHTGLTPAALSTGLEQLAAKAEDDHGF